VQERLIWPTSTFGANEMYSLVGQQHDTTSKKKKNILTRIL
jgi:hypothetical protein